MSPFSNIWARNQGGSTTRIPASDLQLRVQVSRESESTTHTLVPPPPPPAARHARQLTDDAFGEFFGGRAPRTRTQTHHRAPPPYAQDWDGEKLPEYSSSPDVEMDTVARLMFKYGFFFPVFWVIGVYFLFVPIRVSEDWQSHKTEEERREMLDELRTIEVKWARRCLCALLSLFLCLTILVVAVVLSRRRRA